jgi:mRNA-degrading endonuclease toxin of MazEF toxin-antitoxin module
MCEQVKSQSILRFKKKRGEVEPDVVAHVQRLVRRFLDESSHHDRPVAGG